MNVSVEQVVPCLFPANNKHTSNGWVEVPLGELCRLVNGKAFNPSGWSEAGLPIIRIQNLNDVAKPFNYWAGTLERQVMVNKGDVLLGWSGTPGTSFGAHIWNRTQGVLNQHIFRVDLDESRIAKEWAVPAINHQLEVLIGKAHGGVGLRHVKKSEVEALPIPLPPLPEQRRIVAILKEQMAAVERARAAAVEQLAAARALPAAYLRSRFDSADAATWQRRRIADFAETCSGSTPSRSQPEFYEGDIPWVKTAELRDGDIFDTAEHVTQVAVELTSLRLLPPNTLLIAMYGQGQTRGRTGRLMCGATTNQACFAILPNDATFDTAYVQCWFRHNYLNLRRETESRGGNQPNLNGVFLRKLEIPFPPLETQHEIAANVGKYDDRARTLVKSLKQQLHGIDAMPATLLRSAFQGKL